LKLILQIALGVFLGTLASQLVVDSWHAYKENTAKAAEEKLRDRQEKARIEQGARIRNLLLQGRQDNKSGASKPPTGFIPDDSR
jgi:hypothetical protein